MNIADLLIDILEKAGQELYKDVMVEHKDFGGVPIALNDIYDIVNDKGFIIFKEKEKI